MQHLHLPATPPLPHSPSIQLHPGLCQPHYRARPQEKDSRNSLKIESQTNPPGEPVLENSPETEKQTNPPREPDQPSSELASLPAKTSKSSTDWPSSTSPLWTSHHCNPPHLSQKKLALITSPRGRSIAVATTRQTTKVSRQMFPPNSP